MTDGPFHEGRGGANPYSREVVPYARTHEQVVEALVESDAHVVGVFSGPPTYAVDLENVVADTGGETTEGDPVVQRIPPGDRTIAESAIASVETFLTRVPIDVDLVSAPAHGALVRAVRAEPSASADLHADRFTRVTPGTRLHFVAEVRAGLPAVITFELRANRREMLERRTVRVEPGPRCFGAD